MALQAFLGALERSADDEGRRLVESARLEADRLIGAAHAASTGEIEAAVARREAELKASVDASLARARQEASVRVMEARARCLSRIFAAAESRLPGELTHDQASRAIQLLLDEALEYVPGMAVVVRCRASLAPVVASVAAASRIGRVIPDPALPWGVVVEAEDGSVRIDNTLVSRLRRREPELSIAVLSRLETGR